MGELLENPWQEALQNGTRIDVEVRSEYVLAHDVGRADSE